jgi:ABC-type amino acid transport substrate-binding protein
VLQGKKNQEQFGGSTLSGVGSMKHSTSDSYLSDHQISFHDYPTVKDALGGLIAGQVDAVVYDMPILRFLVANEMQDKVQVLRTSFEKQHYGIGLSTASPLREKINQLIPAIITQKKWQDILFHYLGEPGS